MFANQQTQGQGVTQGHHGYYGLSNFAGEVDASDASLPAMTPATTKDNSQHTPSTTTESYQQQNYQSAGQGWAGPPQGYASQNHAYTNLHPTRQVPLVVNPQGDLSEEAINDVVANADMLSQQGSQHMDKVTQQRWDMFGSNLVLNSDIPPSLDQRAVQSFSPVQQNVAPSGISQAPSTFPGPRRFSMAPGDNFSATGQVPWSSENSAQGNVSGLLSQRDGIAVPWSSSALQGPMDDGTNTNGDAATSAAWSGTMTSTAPTATSSNASQLPDPHRQPVVSQLWNPLGYAETAKGKQMQSAVHGSSILPRVNREAFLEEELPQLIEDIKAVCSYYDGNDDDFWRGLCNPELDHYQGYKKWIPDSIRRIHQDLFHMAQLVRRPLTELISWLRSKLGACTTEPSTPLGRIEDNGSASEQASSSQVASLPSQEDVVSDTDRQKVDDWLEARRERGCACNGADQGDWRCVHGRERGGGEEDVCQACFALKNSWEKHCKQLDPPELWLYPRRDGRIFSDWSQLRDHVRKQQGKEAADSLARSDYRVYQGSRRRYCRWCRKNYGDGECSWKEFYTHVAKEHLQAPARKVKRRQGPPTAHRAEDSEGSGGEDGSGGGDVDSTDATDRAPAPARPTGSRDGRGRGRGARESGQQGRRNAQQSHDLAKHSYADSAWTLYQVSNSFSSLTAQDRKQSASRLTKMWATAAKDKLWCFVGCSDPMAEAALTLCRTAFDRQDNGSLTRKCGGWIASGRACPVLGGSGRHCPVLRNMAQPAETSRVGNLWMDMLIEHRPSKKPLDSLHTKLKADIWTLASDCWDAAEQGRNDPQAVDDMLFDIEWYSQPELSYRISRYVFIV